MAKRKSLQESLKEISELRRNPKDESTIEKLHQALEDKRNHVVAAAAGIIGEARIVEFEEVLVQTFHRFMVDPVKLDPGCVAKAAIAEALYRMDAYQEELFLQGVRHIQLEPVYGGREDTAAKLRVASAMGLVGMGFYDAMVELAHLLADSELDARMGAIRAIANSRQDAGIPLLRYKALMGDEDPRVLLECFKALLAISPEPSLAFVGGFLEDGNVTVCEAAAVALGESQLEGAFEILKMGLENVLDSGLRRIEMLAMAMLRDEEAIEFLLTILAEEPQSTAEDALFALEMYRDERAIWNRVEKITSTRKDIKLK
jgi:HEAT repeat protein